MLAGEMMFDTCRVGDTKALESLLHTARQSGVSIDCDDARACDYAFTSPLMIASKYGRDGCVELLLMNGANAGHQNVEGDTALHYACAKNQPDTLRMLLRARNTSSASASASASASTPGIHSVVNLVNSDNCTALMLAAHYNHHECVRVLLDHENSGSDAHVRLDLDTADGNSGLTALESAVAEGAHETVLLLRAAQLRREGNTHTGKPLRAKL
jgi:ankyrin repeat protein